MISRSQAMAIMDPIPGWLMKAAAAFTFDLIRSLDSVGYPICEIGVFRGKYLSILQAAAPEGTKLVGYDLYPRNQENLIRSDFKNFFGSGSIPTLVKVDSTSLTPQKAVEDCGGNPFFISIDGSHEAGPVESDLRLTEKILTDDGIVALDDFCNPYAIGVNEGFYRYQHSNTADERLLPFAFVTNKLFLARSKNLDRFSAVAHKIMMENLSQPYMQKLRQRIDRGAHIETNLLGRRVLTITA